MPSSHFNWLKSLHGRHKREQNPDPSTAGAPSSPSPPLPPQLSKHTKARPALHPSCPHWALRSGEEQCKGREGAGASLARCAMEQSWCSLEHPKKSGKKACADSKEDESSLWTRGAREGPQQRGSPRGAWFAQGIVSGICHCLRALPAPPGASSVTAPRRERHGRRGGRC